MKKYLSFLCFLVLFQSAATAQVNFTANDQVPPYTDFFRPGVNFDYYPPYTTTDLINIAAGNPSLGLNGVGAKAYRPALYENFAENWGLDFFVDDFQHAQNLGMKNASMIVGFPAEWHREQSWYCDSSDPNCGNDPYNPYCKSTLFDNLYTPIWDDANGTPYNDTNYLAKYMYELVTLYKDNVKFWEIWESPGFDFSYTQGWQPPGGPNNWWDNDPSPCANRFHAPIQHYIRTLRICYDVIKTVDPDAYVTLSGVGYESFLDAILRNTDNPDGGSVTAAYPLGGGAYFDCFGFKSYPDIDGSVRTFDPNDNLWVYHRNSDAAAQGLAERKNKFQNRLETYGYNGTTYPKKEWIISEINAPRVPFGLNTMASDESQINYITKAVVQAMREDIRQMYVYQIMDRKDINQANGEFDLLGLYKNNNAAQPSSGLGKTNEGIAYATTSHFIWGTHYDADRSAALNLPSNIDGAAFYDPPNQRYKYILWAKTTQDLSEVASGSYSFPTSFGLSTISKIDWDFSETNNSTDISTSNIPLTGRPIYLAEPINPIDPLTISCPINQTIVGTPEGVTLDWLLPTAISTCVNDSLTFTQTTGTPYGTTLTTSISETITYEVTDSCGHVASCQFDIIATVPNPSIHIQCPSIFPISVAPGETGATVTWDEADVILTANCGTSTSFQLSGPANGSFFPIGLTKVQYLGVMTDCLDTISLSATCSIDILILGQSNPTITFDCPSDTIILGNTNEVTLDWDLPTATTSCTASDIVNITQTSGPASGTTFNSFGQYYIGYSFSDSCGDYTHCYFTVLAQLAVDTPEISMTCPPDTTIEVAFGNSGQVINWNPDDILLTTNCGSPNIIQTEGLANGSMFPIGETKIKQLGVALYDHTSTITNDCSFTIQVKEVVGNNDLNTFRQFDIYPNPSNDIIHLKIDAKPAQQIDIEILDPTGRTFLAEKYPFHTGQLQTSLDLSKLPSGIYLIKAKTPSQLTLKSVTIFKE